MNIIILSIPWCVYLETTKSFPRVSHSKSQKVPLQIILFIVWRIRRKLNIEGMLVLLRWSSQYTTFAILVKYKILL